MFTCFAPANLPPHPPFFVKKIMRKARSSLFGAVKALASTFESPCRDRKDPAASAERLGKSLAGHRIHLRTWGKIVRSWVEVASVGVRLLLFITCSLQCFFSRNTCRVTNIHHFTKECQFHKHLEEGTCWSQGGDFVYLFGG